MEPRPANKFVSFLRRRKRLLISLGVLLCLFIFKGTLYRACVSYELVFRYAPSDNTTTHHYVEEKSIEDICSDALDSTAAHLSFTTEKCETRSFWRLKEGRETNCIGYAVLCMYYCDSDLMRGKHTGVISAQHYAAQLYVLGYDIHNLFDNPFWKNHDVVVIENTISKEKIILDPTLYDYTGIGIVKERSSR